MNAQYITKKYKNITKYLSIFFIFIQCNDFRPATLTTNKLVEYETEMFHQMS